MKMQVVPIPTGPIPIVVVERIEHGVKPEYVICGQATCVGNCGEWIWLGDQAYELVASGEAFPLCEQCAQKHIPPGRTADGRIENTKRPS